MKELGILNNVKGLVDEAVLAEMLKGMAKQER
jgi:hypothetical protein